VTGPKPSTKRPGIVYAVDLIDHVTGEIRRADYVGQTRQLLRSRAGQHRDDQPWSDLIVGDFYPVAQGTWTNAQLDAAEADMIDQLRPRMNYLLNEDNPERVPKWTQREQRWERDDAAGRPRWIHPDDRVDVPVPVVDRRGVVAPRWRLRWAWVAATWSASTAAIWLCLTLAGLGAAMPLPAQAWLSVLVAGVGVGRWQGLGRSPRRRNR
jgi:hypothetical protein